MNRKEKIVLYFLCVILLLGIIGEYVKKLKEEKEIERIKLYMEEKTTEEDIFPVEINTASFEELVKIPGIGPVIANRIIEERRKKPFENIKELLRVKGIGKKKLNIIKNYVIIKKWEE